MGTQFNQEDIKKKGIQVNPSRDVDSSEKEKDFSGEFGEQIDEEKSEEVNPSKFDKEEVDLHRGGVEFEGQDKSKEVTEDLGGDASQVNSKMKSNEAKSYPANQDQQPQP